MAVITEYDTELIPGTIPPFDPASDLLLRAADYLEEWGWVQNKDHDGFKRCAVSAIFAVDGHPGGYGDGEIPAYLQEAIARLAKKVTYNRPSSPILNPCYSINGGKNIQEIVWWNDHVARDQDHVVRTLREVA